MSNSKTGITNWKCFKQESHGEPPGLRAGVTRSAGGKPSRVIRNEVDDMTSKITATHENGTILTQEPTADSMQERTISLMKECGYIRIWVEAPGVRPIVLVREMEDGVDLGWATYII